MVSFILPTDSYNLLLQTFQRHYDWCPKTSATVARVKKYFKKITGLSINATVTPELFNGNIQLLMADPLTTDFGSYLTLYDFHQER